MFKVEVVIVISIPSLDFVSIDDEIFKEIVVLFEKYIYSLSGRELVEKIHSTVSFKYEATASSQLA